MYTPDSLMCCLLRCKSDNYYLEGSGVWFRLLDIMLYLLNWSFALWTLLVVFQLTLSSMLELMVCKFQRKMATHNTVDCSRSACISRKPTAPCKPMTSVSAKTTRCSARWETTANDQVDDSSSILAPCRKESSDECSDVDSSCTSVESFLRETAYSSHRGTGRSKSVCSSNTTKSSARCTVCSSSSDSCEQKDDIHSDSSEIGIISKGNNIGATRESLSKSSNRSTTFRITFPKDASDHSKILSSTPDVCAKKQDKEAEDEEKQCCVWSLDQKSTKQFCATRQNMIFSSDHGRAFYSPSVASCRPMIKRVYSKQNSKNASISFKKRNKSPICLMQSDACQKKKYN